jgi:hypothetical protein
MPKVVSKLRECCICLIKKVTVNQPCGLTMHSACNACITRIIGTIPISEIKPEINCQYPFGDCDAVYSSSVVKSILKDKYPVYRKARDRYTYVDCDVEYCPGCSKILVFDDGNDGGVYRCPSCENSYCMTCSEQTQFSYCIKCNGFVDQNPNSYNTFFYKKINRKDISDYLIRTCDINPDTAVEQLVSKIENNAVCCPVCETLLYRTEQCNSLKHCHVEICSSCGEFSDIGSGLGDHWSARGINGCCRWETDPAYAHIIPKYLCRDSVCYSHNSGECKRGDHLEGRNEMELFKKKQYIYHSLKSLIPRIRYKVVEKIPPQLKEFLPTDAVLDFMDCYTDFRYIRRNMMPQIGI